MSYEKLAKMIVENIGGESNISSITYCATRLRFKLHDDSKAKKEVLESSPDILSVMNSGGQFQIIIGTHVAKVYEQVAKVANIQQDSQPSDSKPTGNIIGRFFNVVSGIFTPLLPVLAGAGVLRGLIMILTQLDWLSESSGTYGILSAASLSVFYFLPILLSITAAKRFGANPYISAAIGASLIHPDFMALLEGVGTGATTDFIGIPVVLMSYPSTVIPAILAIWAYSYLERFLEKHIWTSIQIILVPLISFVIIVPLTAIIFGPFGVYVGEGLAGTINYLSETNGWITGLLIGGVWNVFVVFGLQWAVNPIMISNISTLGFDKIVPLTAAANFGMAGATFGVLLKTKNKKMRSFSLSALISIFFAGITEPAIYGVAIKLKRPFIAAVIGGAAGGAFIGGFQVIANAFVFGGLTTLPAFVGSTFTKYVLGLLICFVVATIATIILGFEDPEDEEIESNSDESTSEKEDHEQVIANPISGEIVELTEIDDGVFSEKMLGDGIAIIPSEGKVYAPSAGEMSTVFPTKHAYGITTAHGAEILIHIGINTVELDGELFEAHVTQGQHVQAGDLLATFDLEKIKEKGYAIYTPVIVTNTASFESIESLNSGDQKHGVNLLKLK